MAREARYDWRHGITKAKIIRIRGDVGHDTSSSRDDDNDTKDRDGDNHGGDTTAAAIMSTIGLSNVRGGHDEGVFLRRRDASYRRLSLTIRKLLDTRKQVTTGNSMDNATDSNDKDNDWKVYANRWNHEVCSCDNDDNNDNADEEDSNSHFKDSSKRVNNKKNKAPNVKSSKVKTNKLKSSKKHDTV